MNKTLGQMVNEFNATYKVDTHVSPTVPTEDQMDAMYSMIHEELIELSDAMDTRDPVAMADALTDIIYIAAQQAAKYGFPVDALLEEVQRSNLSKLGEDGQPIFREDGKVLKGKAYTPPDIVSILIGSGYDKAK